MSELPESRKPDVTVTIEAFLLGREWTNCVISWGGKDVTREHVIHILQSGIEHLQIGEENT